jgi:hypothetical protein
MLALFHTSVALLCCALQKGDAASKLASAISTRRPSTSSTWPAAVKSPSPAHSCMQHAICLCSAEEGCSQALQAGPLRPQTPPPSPRRHPPPPPTPLSHSLLLPCSHILSCRKGMRQASWPSATSTLLPFTSTTWPAAVRSPSPASAACMQNACCLCSAEKGCSQALQAGHQRPQSPFPMINVCCSLLTHPILHLSMLHCRKGMPQASWPSATSTLLPSHLQCGQRQRGAHRQPQQPAHTPHSIPVCHPTALLRTADAGLRKQAGHQRP